MNIGPAPSPPWFGSVAVDGWGGRWGAEGEVGDEEEKEGEVRGDGAHRRGRARKEWQKKRKPFHVHSGHQLGWHLMWKWLKCFKDINCGDAFHFQVHMQQNKITEKLIK